MDLILQMKNIEIRIQNLFVALLLYPKQNKVEQTLFHNLIFMSEIHPYCIGVMFSHSTCRSPSFSLFWINIVAIHYLSDFGVQLIWGIFSFWSKIENMTILARVRTQSLSFLWKNFGYNKWHHINMRKIVKPTNEVLDEN